MYSMDLQFSTQQWQGMGHRWGLPLSTWPSCHFKHERTKTPLRFENLLPSGNPTLGTEISDVVRWFFPNDMPLKWTKNLTASHVRSPEDIFKGSVPTWRILPLSFHSWLESIETTWSKPIIYGRSHWIKILFVYINGIISKWYNIFHQ